MGERQEYTALEWVNTELAETLTQAQRTLAAYEEEPGDITRLQFCLTYLHQVRGTLEMVEVHGAALLAREMEALAAHLLHQADTETISNDALSLLLQGILQLPAYLERLQLGSPDHPAIMSPLINELRAARGLGPVEESRLFAPDLTGEASALARPLDPGQLTPDTRERLRKLRQLFQYALLGYLRDDDSAANLDYLRKAAQRLSEQLGDTGAGLLWHISTVLIAAKRDAALPDDADIRQVLSKLERQLGHLIQATDEGRSPTIDTQLLHQMLYFIARAHPATREIADLQSRFSLEALPAEQDVRVATGREAMQRPDRHTVSHVTRALIEELTEVKEQLDIFVREQAANPQRLSELVQPLRQISDTMSMLQLGPAREVLNDQITTLETLSRQAEVDPQVVMDVAGGLLYVESTLRGLDDGEPADAPAGDGEVLAARRALTAEIRNAIESCKEAIVNYIGAQWNADRLAEVPAWLQQIQANLDIFPLPEPARVIAGVRHYVERELIGNRDSQPDWPQMDRLADALMGVDYYLERLPRDPARQPDPSILERARASLEALGYPDPAPTASDLPESDAAVKASLDDYFDHIGQLSEEDIEAAWDAADLTEAEPAEAEEDHVTALSADTGSALSADTGSALSADTKSALSAETAAPPDTAETTEALAEPKEDDAEEEPLDDDIRAVFLEEAEEVLVELDHWYPQYSADPENRNALQTVRRSFHTLKGSGRMVQAQVISELAWAVENMLNRLLDGAIDHSAALLTLLDDVIALLPELVEDFAHNRPSDQMRVDELSERAHHLARGGPPPDPTTALADDEAAESASATESEASEATDEDGQLYSIFQQEIRHHLSAITGFLTRHRHSAEPSVDDALQRALHTIKGSAHMAGITPMADLVAPVEELVRVLQSMRQPVDESVRSLLGQTVALVEGQLQALDRQQPPEPAPDGHFDAVKDIQARLADLSSAHQTEPAGSLVAIFLNEAINTVLDAENTLTEWQQGDMESSRVQHLRRDLITLADAARAIELLPLSSLTNQLILLYEHLEQTPPTGADDPVFEVLFRAHESIIDMMDRLAAGQSVQEQQALENELAALASAPLAGPDQLPVDDGASALSTLRDRQTAEATATDGTDPPGDEDTPPWDAVTGKEPDQPLSASTPPAPSATPATPVDDSRPPWEAETAADCTPAGTEPLPDESAPTVPVGGGDPELVDIFLEEAGELLETIAEALEKWLAEPDDRSPVVTLQRDLHTLKGGARMAEIAPIADLAHELEFIYEGLSTDQLAADPALLAEVQQAQDELAEMIQQISLHQSCPPAQHRIARLRALRRGEQLPEAGPETTALDTATQGSAFFSPVELENLDPDILEVFVDEAAELVHELDESIAQWRERPSNELAADEMKRVLHTLKGGARLARLPSLGTLSHELETFVIRAQQDRVPLNQDFFRQVLQQHDLIAQAVEELQALLGGTPPTGTSEDSSSNVIPFQRPEPGREADTTDTQTSTDDGNAAPQRRVQPQETVKVNATLLENLVNLAGESSISRARLEEQISDLGFTLNDLDTTIDRLREKVRQLDIETEAQVLFRQERAEETDYQDFDPLEMDRYSQIQQLSRSLMETSSDLVDLRATLANKSRDAETVLLQQSRIHSDLQEGLMQTRMVPFARLVPRLRRIVRQVCNELDKQARFEIENAEGEMDRSVLERMVSPLEHMLRNAVDHGLEDAAGRAAAGKPAEGLIRLNLQREGGDIVLRLSDDGQGINVDDVRAKALERGLIDADSEMDDHEVLQFILTSGFSTASEVTQISGRGVGMDVVHNEVKALGGTMDIATTEGAGTVFTVRLPFTVSVNRALMVGVGEDIYAIPLNTIDGVARVQPDQLSHYLHDDHARFAYGSAQYRVRSLAEVMGADHQLHVDELTHPQPLILVKAMDRKEPLAMHVDRLMGSREVVVKTLGPQFASVPSVSGATILGDGSVVVILDLPALLRSHVTSQSLEHAAPAALESDESDADTPVQPQRAIERTLNVMVVDDSVTVRKVTSRLLERHGMQVLTAKDGVDAMTQLQDHEPDIILLDIEMPRMDGFEVANRVRHTERLSRIPIIMITSRSGQKHKDRAHEIGVNEYMGKPFQEGPLLDAIRRLTREP
ncbi:hybrid sensor histidine kinase/response regulator [Natronospirillum operosum]|uniref:Chemotaxis protein CheA n=1 Tax=Natronospirillum operosum TaxID=2759953 RepID=A0A4Z0W6A7_9GAMM|nr:Hpt domain-containing protein [Natronospirillum operosum]TGG90321.1 hybrid sensor histidine kinase/response regulator [Natronospirillum operosum]